MGLLQNINLLFGEEEYINSAALLAKAVAFVSVGGGNCVSWLQRFAVLRIECNEWP